MCTVLVPLPVTSVKTHTRLIRAFVHVHIHTIKGISWLVVTGFLRILTQ